MNNSHELNLKTTGSLIMIPKMQEAIQILQLNNSELSDYIESEHIKNPFLAYEPCAKKSCSYDSNLNYIENIKYNESIYENLENQIKLKIKSKEAQKIGIILIKFLDEHGIIETSTENISKETGIGIPKILSTIKILQEEIEPVGMFAQNIEECIKIKLDNDETIRQGSKLYKNIIKISKEFKNILSPNIIKKLDISKEDFIKALNYIKKLGLTPNIHGQETELFTKIPDVIIKEDGGNWKVEINTETLPKTYIDTEYYALISKNLKTKQEKNYVSSHIKNAKWMLSAIEQRTNTILKISKELLYQQHDFFEKGPEYLIPMTLKDLATETGLHESTVCRATNNKILLTDFGIFDFKYFFSSSIESINGESKSSNVIKQKIIKLIKSEDKDNPFSDDLISTILLKTGINISRRTVTKYRESMNIPSSQKRKAISSFYIKF